MPHTPPQKVLLIGWDAADWNVIHPLLDAGKMPVLEQLVSSGVMGNLATLSPDLSPMLWTSIATGKRPFKHGIHGFTEPDPDSGGIRPISNLSRKTKAIWNIICQAGKKCNVIGWWPSHPAEPIDGVMVSNHYQKAAASYGKPWPMRPGTVHPKRLVRNLAELRVHPQELDAGLVMNFVPRLAEIDQEKDRRIEGIAKIIAETTTISRAAAAVMHHEPWNFTAVYFDGIDHFCHGYMKYHPPRLDWVDEQDFELYNSVVESGYIYHDILLGGLLEEAGEDTLAILVSDHGFHSGRLRPRNIPNEPAGPAAQHRRYGVLAMKGPGVLEDETLYGATLLDICPTILAAMGLPIGLDMDGKPLVAAFRNPPDFTTIPGWDEVPGKDGAHSPDRQVDPVEAREAINQLVALGYIEEPPEDREKAVESTVRELRYNVARSYMDAGCFLEALPILEDLHHKWTEEYRFGIQLAACLEALGRIRESRPLLEELFRRKDKNVAEAAEKLKTLNERTKETEAGELTEDEKRVFRKNRARAHYNPYAMEYLMGSLLLVEGDMDGALNHFKNAEKADPGRPEPYIKTGDAYLKMKRWKAAGQAFEAALSLDPESAQALLGLCRSLLGRRMNKKAASAAMDAVGLLYFYPLGHFLLGKALGRMGETERAVQALKVAVAQNPNFPEAWDHLADIFSDRLWNPIEADHCREMAAGARKRREDVEKGTVPPGLPKKDSAGTVLTSVHPVPEIPVQEAGADPDTVITIVTGLPRSGTSMMMQMLSAGGIPALTDGLRKADEDNPRGYFEFEKTVKLKTDGSWLPEARGKVVKIIAQLLEYLPKNNGLEYRVIFMERDLGDVLPSQRTMLERRGKPGADLTDEKLKAIFTGHVDKAGRILAARNIPTLYLNYNESLVEPERTAGRINAFLGGMLEERQMAAAMDPALCRHGQVSRI